MAASYVDYPFSTPAGVKGKPFYARYERIDIKKLPDGQTAEQVRTGSVYRDSLGRSRRETNATGQSGLTENQAVIHNPVNQEIIFLETTSKSATRVSVPEITENGEEQSATDVLKNFSQAGEYIGERIIEDLSCLGYRLNQPGGGAIDYWISSDLLEVMLAESKSIDSNAKLRLFDIHSIEPTSDLFTVPSDYVEVNEEDW